MTKSVTMHARADARNMLKTHHFAPQCTAPLSGTMHALALCMATTMALKALTISGKSPIHGDTQWDLPTQGADGAWTPGAWQRVAGPIAYRANGLHVCGCDQVKFWRALCRRIRPGVRTRVWIVECEGQTSIGAHGFAARRVRLVRPWDGREEV